MKSFKKINLLLAVGLSVLIAHGSAIAQDLPVGEARGAVPLGGEGAGAEVAASLPESLAVAVKTLREGKTDEVAALLGVLVEDLESPDGVEGLRKEHVEGRGAARESLVALERELKLLESGLESLGSGQRGELSTVRMFYRLRTDVLRQDLMLLNARIDETKLEILRSEAVLEFLAKQSVLAVAIVARNKRSAEAEKRRKEVEKEAEAANKALVRVKKEQKKLAKDAKGGSNVGLKLSELKDEQVLLLEQLAAEALRDAYILKLDNHRASLRSDGALERELNARVNKLLGMRDTNGEQRKGADKFFDEMVECRGEARVYAWHGFDLYSKKRDLAETGRKNLESLRALLSDATRKFEVDPKDDVAKAEYEVAKVRIQVREREVEVLSKEAGYFLKAWKQDAFKMHLCKGAQKAVIPLLSPAKVERLYALQFQDGTKDIEGEVLDLVAQGRLVLFEFLGMDGGDKGVNSLWNWVLWLPRLLLLLLAFIFVFRFLRKNRKRIVDALGGYLLGNSLLARRGALIVKFIEVFEVIFLDIILLVLLTLLLSVIGPADEEVSPLVVLANVLVGAIFIYRILMGTIRTLVLPRWFRDKETERGAGGAPAQEDGKGVDLFRLELQRAKFIVTTFRFMLLYTLVCQYSHFLVRQTLGEFFLGRALHILAYFGYVVVIYVLLSLWKEFIANQFGRLSGDRWGRAVSFINNHKDRYYGVVVIFAAFLYVVSRELWVWVKRIVFNQEVTRKAINYAFRKRIEMESEDGAEPALDLTDLPLAYVEVFENKPLSDEVYSRVREKEIEEIQEVVERWEAKLQYGAVAIIGEFGMGKTTLLNHLESRLSSELSVLRGEVKDKITTAADLFSFIETLFALTPVRDWTLDTMVASLRATPRRVVILDRCHNLFLRHVGGFGGVEAFMELVALTNDHHAWLTAFNSFSWHYLDRYRDWGEAFRVVTMKPLDDESLRTFIEARSKETGFEIDFSLLGGQRGGLTQEQDIVRSAKGYYSLLADHSRGNPRVAMSYWLRSLRPTQDPKRLALALFNVPETRAIALGADFRFILAATIQHDCLSVDNICKIINVERTFCAMALDQFKEMEVIEFDPETGRASMEAVYYQQILKHLQKVNFLFG